MGVWDLVVSQFARIDYGQMDFELFKDVSDRAHMRRVALETVLGFVSRTAMQTEYTILDADGKPVKDVRWYRMNIQPNKNQTASDFWRQAYYKLMEDGELLIIQTDDEDLLVADSFERLESAVKHDQFINVQARGYEFKRTFTRDRVLYVRFRNDKLAAEFDELYKDYGLMFGQTVEFQRVKNQLRATVDVDTIVAKSKEGQDSLQAYINRLYESFTGRAVAIVPQQKGLTYNEHSTAAGQSLGTAGELEKLRSGYIDAVAEALGVPNALLHADNVENDGHFKLYLKTTLNPLLQLVTDELTVGLLTEQEILDGYRVKFTPMSFKDVTEMAEAIDKLVSSGVFTPNDVLRLLGFDPVDDPEMDKRYITKNFTGMAEPSPDESDTNVAGNDNEGGDETNDAEI